MKEMSIHGFKVRYEDNAKSGVDYLVYDLQSEEARVFFDQAKQKLYAQFEDEKEGQFTITYNADGSYTIFKR